MPQKNIKTFIYPIVAIVIFTLLVFAAGYAYFTSTVTMNTANYQVSLPKTTALTCTKTDCGVTITPAMMTVGNVNATTAKSTSTCSVACTCSGTQNAVCSYNVSLIGTGVTYAPTSTLGTSNEFTVQVTSPTGCTAQNSSSTATQINSLNNKVVSSCSLTVPASGSTSATVSAQLKWYNLNIDQSIHATRIYNYRLTTGKLLPAAYTELQYVEATGAQYFSSGITPSNNFTVETMAYVASGNSTEIAMIGVSGIEYYYSNGVPCFWISGAGSTCSVAKYNTVAKYVATITPSLLRLDVDGTVYSKAWTYTPGTSALFVSGYSSSSYLFKGRIYNMKIYKDFVLVREFIPAKNSSNVAGFYDLVSGTFYTSSSSTAFVAGPNA